MGRSRTPQAESRLIGEVTTYLGVCMREDKEEKEKKEESNDRSLDGCYVFN